MILCDYGCGNEALFKLSNNKWCCSIHRNSCPELKNKNKISNLGKTHSEETKLKIGQASKGRVSWIKGKTHSEETKLKIGQASKGRKHSEETKFKISQSHIGKIISEETKLKLSKAKKGIAPGNKGKSHSLETKKKIQNTKQITIDQIKKRYPTFSKIEEMRYDPDKPGEKEIQVHCKNHNCPNSKEQRGWFTPLNKDQFRNRIWSIEKDQGNGGMYFYCCNDCKDSCPLYNKSVNQLIKEDQVNAGIIENPWYSSSEYLTWRKHIFELDDNKCQWCGNPAEHAHHILPQKSYPQFSLDPDNGIACCQECHFKYGHRDKECTTGYLSKLICERIIRIKSKENI